MSVRSFLIRGLLAGFIAGLLSFGVAKAAGEPSVDEAIAVEEAGSAAEPAEPVVEEHSHDEGTAAHSHGAGAEVSRETQSTWGLLSGTLLVGIALGGIMGLLAAYAVGRIGLLRPGASTAVVVALGFIVFYGVQWFKYPPNPPAVGQDSTLTARTSAYFVMMLISLVAVVAGIMVAQALAPRLGGALAVAAGVVLFAVVVTVAAILMPAFDEVPADFPATTLSEFRSSSLLIQVTLWSTIGLVLGVLTDRATRSALADPHADRSLVAA